MVDTTICKIDAYIQFVLYPLLLLYPPCRYKIKLLHPGWIQQFICISRVDTTKIKVTKQIGYMHQFCKLLYPPWIHVYPILLKLDTKPLLAKPPFIHQGCHLWQNKSETAWACVARVSSSAALADPRENRRKQTNRTTLGPLRRQSRVLRKMAPALSLALLSLPEGEWKTAFRAAPPP